MSQSESHPLKNFQGMRRALLTSSPGMPKSKWIELLMTEDTSMFILGIREDIVNRCLDICYANYLETQTVPFTVHCAYLAWVKVFNVFYMFRDPGDTDDPNVRQSWEPDEEPRPSIIDSWGSNCIQPSKPLPAKEKKQEEKTEEPEEIPVPTQSISCSTESETIESSSSTTIFDGDAGEYFFPEAFTETSSFDRRRNKSIFSKTLSMSEKSLPLVKPLSPECNENETGLKKKVTTLQSLSPKDPTKQNSPGGRDKKSSVGKKKKRLDDPTVCFENLRRLAVSYSVKPAKDNELSKRKDKLKSSARFYGNDQERFLLAAYELCECVGRTMKTNKSCFYHVQGRLRNENNFRTKKVFEIGKSNRPRFLF